MPLTLEQKQTLKAALLADTTVLAFPGGSQALNNVFGQPSLGVADAAVIADYLNGAASPAYQIYRTFVPMSEIMLNGFDWTRVDNLSVGKARIWDWMREAGNQSIDPSKPNIRAGINAVWVGTQADLNVRAAVYDHCYKAANRVEKLFATGGGTVPAQDGSGPGVPTFQGQVSANDIQDIHGLPPA